MTEKCYLLDTNILGYLAEVKAGVQSPEGMALQKRLSEIKDVKVFICPVTVGEIEYGLQVAPYKDPEKQALARKMLDEFQHHDINIDIAREQYAKLRARIFELCAPNKKRQRKNDKKRIEEWIDPTTSKELQIQENDVWISAVAMAYNMVLVTHDKMDAIKKVTGDDLTIVDWAK